MATTERTPKQQLRSHIVNDHHRQPAKSWTMAELSAWHAEQHWKFLLNHDHFGAKMIRSDRKGQA